MPPDPKRVCPVRPSRRPRRGAMTDRRRGRLSERRVTAARPAARRTLAGRPSARRATGGPSDGGRRRRRWPAMTPPPAAGRGGSHSTGGRGACVPDVDTSMAARSRGTAALAGMLKRRRAAAAAHRPRPHLPLLPAPPLPSRKTVWRGAHRALIEAGVDGPPPPAYLPLLCRVARERRGRRSDAVGANADEHFLHLQ